MAMTLCMFVLSSFADSQETADSFTIMTQASASTAQTHAENSSFSDKLYELWDTQKLDVINIVITLIALVVAVWSLQIACKSLNIATQSLRYDKAGYEETKRTADNVTRASFNVQKGQFDDLIRHLYRNLVCTLAFTQRVVENREAKQIKESKLFSGNPDAKAKKGTKSSNGQSQKRKGKHFSMYRKKERQGENQPQPDPKEVKPQKYQYPSEEHLMKLKVLPEDVLHLESYNHDYTIYQKMHNLKLLLRNYDMEIDTAMTYLKDGTQGNAVIWANWMRLLSNPCSLFSRLLK